VIFFRKLLENIVGLRDDKTLHTGSLRVFCFRKFSDFIGYFRKFTEMFGKYCWSARRISSDRFLKGDFFFGNFWKLLENIVGVRDDKSLHTGSLRVICFRKFSEIIENIVRDRDE
jgi:hypothetical protein